MALLETMAKNNKYKILYILGSAHCGSTLLEMLLGTSERTFSVGELAFYSHYVEKIPHKKIDKKVGFVCKCKKQLDDCLFWNRVIAKVNRVRPVIKNRGSLETYKIFFNIINPFSKYITLPTKIGKNKLVYDSIFREAKRLKPKLKYLIDSSKDPRRLYELLQDKQINNQNIFVIYLVRDGRAYLNSYKKDMKTISGVKKRNMFLTMGEWIAVQMSSRALIKKYKFNHMAIPYHRLATDTDNVLNEAFDFIGQKNGENSKSLLKTINKSEYHNLHGNIVKYKPFKKISYDLSWKKGLTTFEKIVSTMVLYPMNYYWVFRKNILGASWKD